MLSCAYHGNLSMAGMVAMRFKSAGRAGLHTTHPESIPQSNGTDCWTGLLLGLAPGRSRSSVKAVPQRGRLEQVAPGPGSCMTQHAFGSLAKSCTNWTAPSARGSPCGKEAHAILPRRAASSELAATDG
jgi:hypothetical protein